MDFNFFIFLVAAIALGVYLGTHPQAFGDVIKLAFFGLILVGIGYICWFLLLFTLSGGWSTFLKNPFVQGVLQIIGFIMIPVVIFVYLRSGYLHLKKYGFQRESKRFGLAILFILGRSLILAVIGLMGIILLMMLLMLSYSVFPLLSGVVLLLLVLIPYFYYQKYKNSNREPFGIIKSLRLFKLWYRENRK